MLYSPSLNSIFTELGITEYTDTLQEYLLSTFFTPNELNANSFSPEFIRSYSVLFKEILNNLESTEITSDLPELFLTLFNKKNDIINKHLILCSKTKFLQIISGTFIYGLLCEVKNFPDVIEKRYDFNNNFNIGDN